MKKMLRMLMVLLMGLSVLLSGCSSESGKPAQGSAQGETYKIGAVIDISGNSSSLGMPERDTMQMLVDELNAKGGINGRKVELTILDNKSDETEAVLAVKTLLEKDVLAILGASSSGPSMAMLKTAETQKVPMVSLAAASSIVEPVNERQWIYKTAQSDTVMIEKIMGYLKKEGITKTALLYMNNAFGDGGRKAYISAAKVNGVQIVTEEKFDASDKDMTPLLTKVKASDAQAVIVWAIPPSASILTKNYKDLGISIPLIHSHGVGNQKFIDLAQGAADGVILPIGKITVADQIPDGDPQKKVLEQYIADYKKTYNTEPVSFGGYAWDAFNLVVNAIEKGGADREAIRKQLEETQGFVGVSGIFNMSPQDHNGLDANSAVLVQIENGKWKIIE